MKSLHFIAFTFLTATPIAATSFGSDQEVQGNLDGVPIEAVETPIEWKHHEAELGLSLHPFKPYYTGFGLDTGYVYHFNQAFAWEVLRVLLASTVQTDLSTQLAEKWKVDPQQIEKLRYIFSTNIWWVHSRGKLLFFERFIRRFRSYLLLGGGLVTTSVKSRASLSAGIGFDAQVSDTFSWKIEFRNNIAIEFRDNITLGESVENFAAFSLSTGIHF